MPTNNIRWRGIVVREYNRLLKLTPRGDKDAIWRQAAFNVWGRSVAPALEAREKAGIK